MLVEATTRVDFLKEDQQLWIQPCSHVEYLSPCGSSPWLLEMCPRSRLAEKLPVTDSVATLYTRQPARFDPVDVAGDDNSHQEPQPCYWSSTDGNLTGAQAVRQH